MPQDDAEAVRWWWLAAGTGDARAQYNLGFSYDTGRDVPQDDAEALRWWRLGAEQGHALAMTSLGTMYFTGRGMPQDYVEAHVWLNLAAFRLSRAEFPYLQEAAVKNRALCAGRMTPDQIAEAQRSAREWDAAHPPQTTLSPENLVTLQRLTEWLAGSVDANTLAAWSALVQQGNLDALEALLPDFVPEPTDRPPVQEPVEKPVPSPEPLDFA